MPAGLPPWRRPQPKPKTHRGSRNGAKAAAVRATQMQRRNDKRVSAAGATPAAAHAHDDDASASATHVAGSASATQVAGSASSATSVAAAPAVKLEVAASAVKLEDVKLEDVKEEHSAAAASSGVKCEQDLGQVLTGQLIGLARMHPQERDRAIKYIEVFGEPLPLRVASDSEDADSEDS